MTGQADVARYVASKGDFHVMVKPAGPRCNLACEYCFYLDKEALYPAGASLRMDDSVLEHYICEHIAAQPGDIVTFAWQGGEPTLMGLGFFEKVVNLQRLYSGEKRVRNALQTNGTLLNDAWGRFLKKHNFLVGISIDGPQEVHDTYRTTRGGGPSFSRVMNGLTVLKRHGVEFNTLTCVHAGNSRRPIDVYRFLKDIGSSHMQFIPVVERTPSKDDSANGFRCGSPFTDGSGDNADVTPWSVRPDDYGYFIKRIFDRWVANDVGRVSIQHIESAFASWLGFGATLCVFSEVCGRALAMEHDGTLYPCDHYVFPELRLGRLGERSLAEIVDSEPMITFGQAKRDRLPRQCRECPVLFACWGGCPKHRSTSDRYGELGLNYLCEAYQTFFHHIDPQMQAMVELFRARKSVADVMKRARA